MAHSTHRSINHWLLAVSIGGIVGAALLYAGYSYLPSYTAVNYNDTLMPDRSAATHPAAATSTATSTQQDATSTADEEATHVDTPEEVKGVYMTSWVASTPSMRKPIIEMIKDTELNSIVIDIKADAGRISFDVKDPYLQEIGSANGRIDDLRAWIKKLHKHDIYVIGRIASFQDPYITGVWPDEAVKQGKEGPVWKNRKGQTWIDPGSKKAWEYMVAIGKESYRAGFDEIQYDYIRFPSDGDISTAYYPASEEQEKEVVIEKFFRYVDTQFEDSDAVVSADLFGMVATNHDDLSVGQVLERALPYFDYISPMVYPSHYPPGGLGFENPAAHPYEVVHRAMERATARAAATSTVAKHLNGERIGTSTPPIYTKESHDPEKIRPWLQDFSLKEQYGAAQVRAQIQATYDAGLDSWMLWDARNTYTREALKASSTPDGS